MSGGGAPGQVQGAAPAGGGQQQQGASIESLLQA